MSIESQVKYLWNLHGKSFEADLDSHFSRYVSELQDLCKIPSVSSDDEQLWNCAEFLKQVLEELRFTVRISEVGSGYQAPIIVAKRHSNPTLPTVLIYGHFDVQPVDPISAWTNPPFEPTIDGDYLYGRGTADDKGQFFAHLKAVEMLDRLGLGDIANITLVLDSQEEVGSPGIAGFVEANKDELKADFVFYADGEAFAGDRIMIQHGNRGDCFLTITHRSASRDAHSGTYGGVMPNAANELVRFLSLLVDEEGTIQIPGFYENVLPPTSSDRDAMSRLPYDRDGFLSDMGLNEEFGPENLAHWEKIMFRPTLNIAGLTSGFQGKGTKTVIPCEASAKIDMRLVKNQTPDEIISKFKAFAAANGMSDITIERGMQYMPARTAVDHPFGKLVSAAATKGFAQKPVVTPVVGGSNPNYVWMEMLNMPMAEISYGQHDCRMHAPDERYRIRNLRDGIVTSALVLLGACHITA